MSAKVVANAYGKSQVRFSKIERYEDRNVIRQMSVDVLLRGDFESAHTEGDNKLVVATDTMRNTVYVLAHRHELGTVEAFASRVAAHFVDTYGHVSECDVSVSESPWERIDDGGKSHATAFIGGGSERQTATAHASATGTRVTAGIAGALILKTADSGFEGFYRDEYATLGDTDDRIFATELTAVWNYDPVPMPNSHHLLMDLSRLGLENKNVIFHPVDEPFGLIKATVGRG